MRLHKLQMKLSHEGIIFIEIFDAKVLHAIYLFTWHIYQDNTVSTYQYLFSLKIIMVNLEIKN